MALNEDWGGQDREDDESLNLTAQELEERKVSGKSTWDDLKMDAAGKQKKKDMIEGLQTFQEANPDLREGKHIEKVKKARSTKELHELETKMKKAAVKWYGMQLMSSGAFNPMDDRETSFVNFELKELVKRFSNLPLAGDDLSMTKVLSSLKEDLKPRLEFRRKLARQTEFIKEEFFALLPTLGLMGSKQELLSKVLAEYEPVLDKPGAIQKAFNDLRKAKGVNKSTAEIKTEAMEGFDKRTEKYKKQLFANAKYFSGEEMESKWGKGPAYMIEFMDWFSKLNSFAEMDAAIKALPSLIAKRKKLYEKRDAIIAKAKPENQKKLQEMTDKMRRHKLDEYMETLEKSVQNDNMHLAEASATLLEEVDGIDLFNDLEMNHENNKLQHLSIQGQEGQVENLKLEAKMRKKVVEDYMKIPENLREDEKFMKANHYERAQMLREAEENSKLDESANPFDTVIKADGEFTNEDLDDFEEELDGKEGEEIIDDIIDEEENRGKAKVAGYITDIRWKIGGREKDMHRDGSNGEETNKQKDAYLTDLGKWTYQADKRARRENEAKGKRDAGKIRFKNMADDAWDKGYAVNSSGLVFEKAELDVNDILNNNQISKEKLDRARYGQWVELRRKDGRVMEDPTEELDQLQTSQLEQMARTVQVILAERYAKGQLSVKNSRDVMGSVKRRLINREFFHHINAYN